MEALTDKILEVQFKEVEKPQKVPQKMTKPEDDKEYDLLLRVVFAGDSGIGAKTSFLRSYVKDEFRESEITTIGVDLRTKYITVRGKKVKLQMWDTPGQERSRTITRSYYKGASGFVLGYDITNRLSYESVKMWFNELKRERPDAVIMLIGSKADLEEYRKVSQEEGDELAEELGIPLFFEGK